MGLIEFCNYEKYDSLLVPLFKKYKLLQSAKYNKFLLICC